MQRDISPCSIIISQLGTFEDIPPPQNRYYLFFLYQGYLLAPYKTIEQRKFPGIFAPNNSSSSAGAGRTKKLVIYGILDQKV